MKRSVLNQARSAGKKQSQPRILHFDWFFDHTRVKTERVIVEELSQFTKIVAHHLSNMPIAESYYLQTKLEVVITSTEQSDLVWAIKNNKRIDAFRKYLLRRGVNMNQVYLILKIAGSDRLIPLFETGADGSIPRPARLK